MKKITLAIIVIISLNSCEALKSFEVTPQLPLTTNRIITGLKQALEIGTTNSVTFLGKSDGFYGSPFFKIPFPEEVKIVEERLRSMGLNQMVDDFIKNMNRGAESAVKLATPIFIDAIKQMSFEDAQTILTGPENAATEYFKSKTSANLSELFKPEVQSTLDKMEVTKHWTEITTTYNRIPFVRKVETDLAEYVTKKTLNALFVKLAEEEKLIRTNPAARVTDVLKEVFGRK